jgi:hypothetical protein
MQEGNLSASRIRKDHQMPEWMDAGLFSRRQNAAAQASKEAAPPVAVVENSLPDSAVVLLHFNAGDPLNVFVAISKDPIPDTFIRMALLRAFQFRVNSIEGSAERDLVVRIYRDGRMLELSEGGEIVRQIHSTRGGPSSATLLADQIQRLASSKPVVQIPLVGPARVVQLSEVGDLGQGK